MLSWQKSLKVLVWSSACRNLREVILIIFIWKNSAQDIWTPLLFHHLLESLVVSFAFSPYVGVTVGLMTLWNSSLLTTSVIQIIACTITINFQNKANGRALHLSNIYGPASSLEKFAFITWLINLDHLDFDDWILARDFNLLKSVENRSKLGDLSEMQLFNNLILDLWPGWHPFQW